MRCRSKGLTSPPVELPQHIFELDLSNNSISSPPCLHLPKLYKLVLRNNRIAHFHRECLKRMPLLAEIDLSYNNLSCIDIFYDISFKKGKFTSLSVVAAESCVPLCISL
ncbi:hypothetical protein Bbelb_351960 [Branchiostoma belcheri]|nr:hypothetical protein Bbelb_351960 [Branchiostoma belcheri]